MSDWGTHSFTGLDQNAQGNLPAIIAALDELLLLRALLRASDYGVLVADLNRHDLICNDRFCEMFDVRGVEQLHMEPDFVELYLVPRLKDPDVFVKTLQHFYADPTLTGEFEMEFLVPERRFYRLYTAPVMNDVGAIIGRLWTFLDVTETRLLEQKVTSQTEQLAKQAKQLAAALKAAKGRLNKVENVLSIAQQQLFESEKLSAVGLLAASVAHDIRNMLTPLTIELTLADQDDSASRRESFAVMRNQIDRLSLLTHRLLALAKPTSTKYLTLDLAALLRRTAELLEQQANMEKVSITVRCPRTPPKIMGDVVQIDQVLVNLALNAIQAMRATDGGTLEIALTHVNGGACVRISDTGPGMSGDVRRQLFDPFFTTKPDGAGLGLFSCRRIIQEHGGHIQVRSRPKQGTQFRVWLPMEEGNHAGKNIDR